MGFGMIGVYRKCKICGEYTESTIDGCCEDCADKVVERYKKNLRRYEPEEIDSELIRCKAREEFDWRMV